MLSRYAAAAVIIGLAAFAPRAAAQELLPSQAVAPSIAASAANVPSLDSQDPSATFATPPPRTSWSTPLMYSLHAVTITTQLLDAHSTIQAIDRGAVEANPLMRGLIDRRTALVAVKAAGGAGLVYLTQRLAKRNKMAAIITSTAVNSLYLFTISHNYGLARRAR